jgi:hypothetical protein
MNARVLLILLMVTVLLALTQRYRRIGMSLSAVLIGLIIWQVMNSVPGTATGSSVASSGTAASSAASVSVNAVRLSRMQLSGNGAPWRLTGELLNTADPNVSAVKIVIERHACASNETETSNCKLLWQGEHTLRIRLAPSVSQSVDENIWSHTTSL